MIERRKKEKTLAGKALTEKTLTGKTLAEKTLTKTWVVWVLALICCFLWGSAFPCVKIGYRLFGIEGAQPATIILFAGMRFTLAGILAAVLGSVVSRKPLFPKKTSWPMILKLSLIQTVAQYVLFYIGLANTTGVRGSIITGVNVFIAVLVAGLLFRQEKLNAAKIIGCVVGFAGMILVYANGSLLGGDFIAGGDLLILGSATAYGFSSAFLKRYSEYEDPVVLSSYQFIAGGVILVVIGLSLGGKMEMPGPEGILMLIYLACISAVAYSVWGILLKYNPVSRVTVFGFMNPVFGVILSSVLLSEGTGLSLMVIVSLALISAGIVIVNRAKSD